MLSLQGVKKAPIGGSHTASLRTCGENHISSIGLWVKASQNSTSWRFPPLNVEYCIDCGPDVCLLGPLSKLDSLALSYANKN